MRYMAVVDEFFLDAPGGAARVAWDIAMAAKKEGHEVAVVSLHRDDRPDSLEQVDGLQVLRVRRPALGSWNPRNFHGVIQNTRRAIQELLGGKKWDVVHTHSLRTGFGAMQALRGKARFIMTLHSPVAMEFNSNGRSKGVKGRIKSLLAVPLLAWIEHSLIKNADLLHVLSRFTRSHLPTMPGLREKTSVIPYWRRPGLERSHTKAEARELLGWPQEQTIFFTLRDHKPRTGIGDAIEAAAPLLGEGRCLFFIGGNGPLRSHYEELSRKLGLEKEITFLGRISDEMLALAYEAADLFLLPTRALECFGLISIEAMSFGCPVLASDSSAIPEVLAPISPAFLFETGDLEEMRKKMLDFLEGRLIPPPPNRLLRT